MVFGVWYMMLAYIVGPIGAIGPTSFEAPYIKKCWGTIFTIFFLVNCHRKNLKLFFYKTKISLNFIHFVKYFSLSVGLSLRCILDFVNTNKFV